MAAATVLDLAITERELSAQVKQLAAVYGWTAYHTWTSVHSAPGFPDWVLVRPPRLIFAELKRERGKVTAAQQSWLDVLAQLPGVEVFVWRPSDLTRIAEVLA